MKITLCGSIQFIEEMKQMKETLEKKGHSVLLPKSAETNQTKDWWSTLRLENSEEFIHLKAERMMEHFNKIEVSDAILVLNIDKNGVKNYIGGNTLMEMGLAFFLKKKIYLWNDIPQSVSYEEEIFGMNPTLLHQNLDILSDLIV